MRKDIFAIREVTNKAGETKTYWDRVGISFGMNKDGSINFTLFMFPDLKLQMREQKDCEEVTTEAEPETF